VQADPQGGFMNNFSLLDGSIVGIYLLGTMIVLFEKRFGQRVRWAAGVVIVLGGLLNPGIWGIGALATLAPEAIGGNTLHAMPIFLIGHRGLSPDGRSDGRGVAHETRHTARHERRIQMIVDHWFWWSLTIACLVWYSTITVYVAVKGFKDIKGMLKRLAAKHDQGTEQGS